MKKNDYANKMLEVLQDSFGLKVATLDLLSRCGIARSLQPSMLKHLHFLAEIGTVSRSRDGGWMWSLVNREWDRMNPFGDETGSTGKPDRKQRISVTVDTSALEARIADLERKAAAKHAVIEIKQIDGTTIKLKDVTLPSIYQHVLDLATCRRNILLVGPAGCGKTFIGKLIADSLGLDFGSLSCTSGMSEAHLLGRSIPDFHKGVARFQSTDFIRLYENGGVFLMDEIDAADSNLLLAINSAIANGYCNVPNRPEQPHAKKHDDFVMIATANTFGRGATRVYAGRNQLDEATLDRFRIGTVACDYEKEVEKSICPDTELLEMLWSVRTKIEAAGLRRILSTRFIEDAAMMRRINWSIDRILDVFFEGWPNDERAKAMPEKHHSGEPTSEETSAITGTDPVAYKNDNGEWTCPTHGRMVEMMSGKGWKCRESGRFDPVKKRSSGCNCVKFKPNFPGSR